MTHRFTNHTHEFQPLNLPHPLLLSPGSLLTLGRLPCPLLLGMPPVLHCWYLITHWQLKLVLPASLGCQLSASPYWTLPGMHRLRKVFLGSCVTADAHWVPAVWENHAGTLPESLSASFGGSCVLGDTLILQMRAPNSMVRERGCHQPRGVWTAEVSLWAGGVPSRSESKDILRSEACAPDSYEAWVVASPYSAWVEFGSGIWLNSIGGLFSHG